MNIALVIYTLGSGGAERILSELANHWIDKGHKVTLFTFASPHTKPFYFLDPRINLLQLGLPNPKRYLLVRFKSFLTAIFYLRKNLRALKLDALVSFIDIMNLFVLLASTGLKIPTLISERIDPHYHSIPWIYQWLRLKLYPKAKKLVVQTESAARYFPENFKEILKIIPNRIQKPSVEKNTSGKEVQKIITVGRLDQQKDHKTLIQAFAALLKLYPHLTLTIYGEGPERKNLEKLRAALKLEDSVFLPGVVANVQEALLRGDLFIFPSLYEGFPNALGEAMAVGLPVIASNCSGNVDIVQDTIDGRLFAVEDVIALTRVASEVIIDYEQRKRLATNAKKVTERFSANRIYTLWDETLLEISKQTKETT